MLIPDMSVNWSGRYNTFMKAEHEVLEELTVYLKQTDYEYKFECHGSTEFCRRLGRELVYIGDETKYEGLCDIELVNRVSMFNQRTQFFLATWDRWTNRFKDEGIDEYYNPVNLFFLFSSIYVQQLEGPFRYDLAAIYDMVKSLCGEDGHWRDFLYKNQEVDDFDKKNFECLINTISQLSGRYTGADYGEHFKNSIDILRYSVAAHVEKSDEEIKSKQIRNSIAHSDYSFRQLDDEIFIQFYYRDGSLKVNLEEFLQQIYRHLMLMYAISVGVSLSIAWIAEDQGRESYVESVLESFDLVNVIH